MKVMIEADSTGKFTVIPDYLPRGQSVEGWLASDWDRVAGVLFYDLKDQVGGELPRLEEFAVYWLCSDDHPVQLNRALPLEQQVGTESPRILLRRRILEHEIELKFRPDHAGIQVARVRVQAGIALRRQLEDAARAILGAHKFRGLSRKWWRVYDGKGQRIHDASTPAELKFEATESLEFRPVAVGGYPLVLWEKVLACLVAVGVVSALAVWTWPGSTVQATIRLALIDCESAVVRIDGIDEDLMLKDGGDSTVVVLSVGRFRSKRVVAEVIPDKYGIFEDSVAINYGERRSGELEWTIGDDVADSPKRDLITLSVRVGFVVGGTEVLTGAAAAELLADSRLLVNERELELQGLSSPHFRTEGLRPGIYNIRCETESGGILNPRWLLSEVDVRADVMRLSDSLFDLSSLENPDLQLNLVYQRDSMDARN